MSAQPSLMYKQLWTRVRKVVSVFSGSQSQSQSPKGFIRVVCSSRSLERAKRRSQSGISGCGHGRWVVPHGRHISEPERACTRILFRALIGPISILSNGTSALINKTLKARQNLLDAFAKKKNCITSIGIFLKRQIRFLSHMSQHVMIFYLCRDKVRLITYKIQISWGSG